MKHSAMGIVLVAPFEIVFRAGDHIGSGDVDVLVVGDVNACAVVHLVVCSCGYWEGRYGTLAMVENGIDVRWEHALVGIVYCHGRVCPPEEGLWHFGRIIYHTVNLEVCTAGTEGESSHSFLVEHPLALVHPYGDAAVCIFLNRAVYWHECGRTMVLRPVELDSSRNPRPCQSYEGWFDDLVVVDEMALTDFVVCHLNPAAQFGQDHDLDIFVLEKYGVIGLVCFLVGNTLDDRVGVDHSTAALIYSFFQEDRGLLWLTCFVSRDDHVLPPCFYHIFNFWLIFSLRAKQSSLRLRAYLV